MHKRNLVTLLDVMLLRSTIQEAEIERLKRLPTIDHSNCKKPETYPGGAYYSAQAAIMLSDFAKTVAATTEQEAPGTPLAAQCMADDALGNLSFLRGLHVADERKVRDELRRLAKEAYEAGRGLGYKKGFERGIAEAGKRAANEEIWRQLNRSNAIQHEMCRQAIQAYPLMEAEIRKYEKDYNLVTLLKVAEDQAFDKGERKGHVEGYQEGRNDGWAFGREEGAAQVFGQGVARGREIEREAVIGESIAKGGFIPQRYVKELIEKVRARHIGDPTDYKEGRDDALNELLDKLEGKSLKEGETTLGAPLDKVVDLAADSGGIQGCEMLPIYGTRDAKTWAEQYLKWVDGRGFSVLPGEEYETFRWFANAIGTGFDLGVKSDAKRNSLNGGDAS